MYSLPHLQLIALILCQASTEEIDALNAILAESCGKVVQVIPPDSTLGVQALDDTDPSQPPVGPGNPPPKPPKEQ